MHQKTMFDCYYCINSKIYLPKFTEILHYILSLFHSHRWLDICINIHIPGCKPLKQVSHLVDGILYALTKMYRIIQTSSELRGVCQNEFLYLSMKTCFECSNETVSER